VTEKKTETTKHAGVVAALVAFQSEMKTVGKDKVNPHFKSRYADISSITEEVAPLLTKHGLAFTCLPRQADGGGYEIVGKLMHETGDWLEGSLPLFGNLQLTVVLDPSATGRCGGPSFSMRRI